MCVRHSEQRRLPSAGSAQLEPVIKVERSCGGAAVCRLILKRRLGNMGLQPDVMRPPGLCRQFTSDYNAA